MISTSTWIATPPSSLLFDFCNPEVRNRAGTYACSNCFARALISARTAEHCIPGLPWKWRVSTKLQLQVVTHAQCNRLHLHGNTPNLSMSTITATFGKRITCDLAVPSRFHSFSATFDASVDAIATWFDLHLETTPLSPLLFDLSAVSHTSTWLICDHVCMIQYSYLPISSIVLLLHFHR